MLKKIKNICQSPKIRCYFVTGTGRCGTMLLYKLLNIGTNTLCHHEASIKYTKLNHAYQTKNVRKLIEDIDTQIKPLVKKQNRKGHSYGEVSGLLYLCLKELYLRYGNRTRFILLVRHPVEFVRSALSRGFFDDSHPHSLEHIRATDTTDIGRRWLTATPFEKCLWYWNEVNRLVYDFFLDIPKEIWRIQLMENISVETVSEIYDFLNIKGFNESAIRDLLGIKVNASPGRGDIGNLNPWARPVTLGRENTWSDEQHNIYARWTKPMLELLYGENK
jgi:hypothetical protein